MAEKNIDKNEILSKEIDKDELETVSGGTAGGPGGCTGSYFREKCDFILEKNSGTSIWMSASIA